jgi:hypothetical protein
MMLKRLLALSVLAITMSAPLTHAATNKQIVLDELTGLTTNAQRSQSTQDALLSTKASEMIAAYEKAITSLSLNPDDIDTLIQSKRMSVSPFRSDLMQEYLRLKQDIFSDIRNVITAASDLRDSINFLSSDLTPAQKEMYETQILAFSGRYASFLTDSQAKIDTFVSTFSGRIAPIISQISSQASANSAYLTFIKQVKLSYATIESGFQRLSSAYTTLDEKVLTKLSNNVSSLMIQKAALLKQFRSNLEDGYNKALSLQPKLAEFNQTINTTIAALVNKWNDLMAVDFADDEALLLASLKAKNILTTLPALRAKIYDNSGAIRFSELSETGSLLSDIEKLQKDVNDTNVALTNIIARYLSGAVLVDRSGEVLNKLNAAFLSELALAQKTLTTTINESLTQKTLQEKNLSQAKTLSALYGQQLNLIDIGTGAIEAMESALATYKFNMKSVLETTSDATILKNYRLTLLGFKKLIVDQKILMIKIKNKIKLENSVRVLAYNGLISLKKNIADLTALQNRLDFIVDGLDARITNPKLSEKYRAAYLWIESAILDYALKLAK